VLISVIVNASRHYDKFVPGKFCEMRTLGVLGELFKIYSGVRQGSLSPLIFIVDWILKWSMENMQSLSWLIEKIELIRRDLDFADDIFHFFIVRRPACRP